jgi:hypothetical protein
MAYLPACDLALLLIDAGNALNDEDIGTLRILYEGGIPALVLLSKADLLAEGDLHRVIAYMETQLQRELGISLHVHAVSALPKYEVLVDHFFERELLPRFEQARSLREASVARKIGALRESVTAALETSLHHEKRGRENLFAIDTQEADAELRRVSGEIGEQQTILDHAFLELGERPESILSELADMATARICSGAKHRITSLTLAEWTYDVVQGRVDHSLAQTRATIENAITTLQTIANKMARSDMPSREDAGALLRDAPRFEIGVIPGSVDVARWKWMGKSIVRLLIKSSLRQNLGPTLKDELHRYGNALSQWSEQMTRKMSALVNSYADAYRAQFNRIRESSPDGEISPEMEIDLGLLLHWDATENTDAKEKRA